MAEALTLYEHTNRGRLFDVEPGFGDAVMHETLALAREMGHDFKRTAFGETFTIPMKPNIHMYPGDPIIYFVPADQLSLFDQPQPDARRVLFEAVIAGHIPMWAYEQLEEDLERSWED